MIDVLHEQGVGLAGREDADRFGGHRPAGQPLHRGAEAVGAAIDQVVEPGFVEQASIAVRRRAISASEKCGYSASWIARRRGGRSRSPDLTGAYQSCHAPRMRGIQ